MSVHLTRLFVVKNLWSNKSLLCYENQNRFTSKILHNISFLMWIILWLTYVGNVKDDSSIFLKMILIERTFNVVLDSSALENK